jgi:altronate hydrolase
VAIRAIRMDEKDNVAVVTADAKPGDLLELADGTQVKAVEAIPRGHKVALASIAAGQIVVRYGEEIGLATEEIAPGQHVHTHNLGGRK